MTIILLICYMEKSKKEIRLKRGKSNRPKSELPVGFFYDERTNINITKMQN